MKALSIAQQFICSLLILGLAVSLMSGCEPKKQKTTTNTDDPVSIAQQAFTYGLPLVLMDISRQQMTNFTTASNAGAPMNQLSNKSGFPTPLNRGVVAPNADTYYSIAFCDFTEGPLVFHMPNTKGRYYVMPLLDAYTNVFESISPRTGDTLGGDYFITRKGWQGTVPKGMTHVESHTGFFWLCGRIQCNGTEDGENVVIPLQNKMKIVPYKYWGTAYTPPPANTTTVPQGSPNDIVQNMPIDTFFNYLNRLLVDNPPTVDDEPAMQLYRKIGVGAGKTFTLDSFNTATQDSMKNIPKSAYAYFYAQAAQPPTLKNGWNINTSSIMGNYGTNYSTRAAVSVMGLGANLVKDAVYPSSHYDTNSNAYVGTNKYQITFKEGKLPVNGFWSLTMYDQAGYFIPNSAKTYAIGHDTEKPFTYNSDGSLTILIQNGPPSDNMKNNWLPAPKDTFYVMMRLYYPKESVLTQTWTPPAITINN